MRKRSRCNAENKLRAMVSKLIGREVEAVSDCLYFSAVCEKEYPELSALFDGFGREHADNMKHLEGVLYERGIEYHGAIRANANLICEYNVCSMVKDLISRENENIGPLVETLLTEETYCTVAGNNLVQIMSKKATKWNGIQRMLEAVGISPEDAVYFGDDNDDVEPLQNCGVGVAVANAIDAVKAVADEITETNDEDGVAKWIERTIGDKA